MEFDKILNADDEIKIKLLKQIIENDVTYWKKILILTSLKENNNDTQLLEKIIDNKIEEMKLFYKKYNINQVVLTKFNIACTQTLEILKHIPEYYYKKISSNFLSRLKECTDSNYKFEIDNKIKFSELNIIDETKDLLLLINNRFWKDEKIDIEIIFNKNIV